MDDAKVRVTSVLAKVGVAVLRTIRQRPLGATAAAWIITVITAAVLAPVLAPYDPLEQESGVGSSRSDQQPSAWHRHPRP